MIAYHVDRSNSLSPNQIVILTPVISESRPDSAVITDLFPDGLSHHGFHYIDSPAQLSPPERASYYVMEYELELVRRSFFPNLPSRFQSFFALEKLEDLRQWDGIFDRSNTIWKIQFDESQSVRLDSNLLLPTLKEPSAENNQSIFFSPGMAFFHQHKYWNGEISDSPRFELLIKPPVQILEQVHI